ncbi:hypothetical protein M0R19_07550 [Candidatus Pacearchaeota archaeon]|jgi:hypothetical protein|nr:hypothetical protein [bacterium]MCK9597016.1 hypothetical protein [Candidatus Pacearchaeota archaeon]
MLELFGDTFNSPQLKQLIKLNKMEKENIQTIVVEFNNPIGSLLLSTAQTEAMKKLILDIFLILKLPNDDQEIINKNVKILKKELNRISNHDLISKLKKILDTTNIQIDSSVTNILMGKLKFKVSHDNSVMSRQAITDTRSNCYYTQFENLIPHKYEAIQYLKYLSINDRDEFENSVAKLNIGKLLDIFDSNKNEKELKKIIISLLSNVNEKTIKIFKTLSCAYRKKRTRAMLENEIRVILSTIPANKIVAYLNIFRTEIRSTKLFWDFLLRCINRKTVENYIVNTRNLKVGDVKIILIHEKQPPADENSHSLFQMILINRYINVQSLLKRDEIWDLLDKNNKIIYCVIFNDWNVKYDKTNEKEHLFFKFMKNPFEVIRNCFNSRNNTYKDNCVEFVKENSSIFTKLSIDPRINMSIPYKVRLEKCRKEGFLPENVFDPNDQMRSHACKEIGYDYPHLHDNNTRIALESRRKLGFLKKDIKHQNAKIRMNALAHFKMYEEMIADSDSEIVKLGKQLKKENT